MVGLETTGAPRARRESTRLLRKIKRGTIGQERIKTKVNLIPRVRPLERKPVVARDFFREDLTGT